MSGLQISKHIYALLVGIDAYRPPVPRLDGCVNDLDAIVTYLGERVDRQDGTALNLERSRTTRRLVTQSSPGPASISPGRRRAM